MREAIKMTNGWTVLNTADLWLTQPEPTTNNILWYPILTVESNVTRVFAISPRNQADVLQCDGVAELFRIPEIVRILGGSMRRAASLFSHGLHSSPLWSRARRVPHRQ
jgi:hypothetical protein